MDVFRRTRCRLCGSSDLLRVLSLAPTPPANAFVAADQVGTPQPSYPLEVYFCRSCTHLQLLDVVDPGLLFENYVYVSGTSSSFVDHFRRYAAEIVRDFGLAPGDRVVDLGSNDGTLLRFFQDQGMTVLGIDPARAIAERANAAGIPTRTGFFSPDLAAQIRAEHGAARVITANNVFAHIDALDDVVAGIQQLLREDGIFVFEVSYLLDVYRDLLFDTIYHEHLSYHRVKPLQDFFRRHGMELVRTLRVPTHGGSLRGFVRRSDGTQRPDPSVAALCQAEQQAGLDRPETFVAWSRAIDQCREQLTACLRDLRAQGARIAGFGAPAKATTLLHHFRIGPDLIEFIVDDSPLKQGLFTPGLHIPVVGPEALRTRRPDVLLILAWNFAEVIMARETWFLDSGGRFLVPLPQMKLVPS